MRVHLVNPSDLSFGVGVITPRWLYVLAGATPAEFGPPLLTDETLEPLDPSSIAAGDIVGIGIHTGNALRGYAVGTQARGRGAFVVFGGIHATLYPSEALEFGGAHAVVKGDGDVIWSRVLADCAAGRLRPLYEAGWVEAPEFVPARWDLLDRRRYIWASVQTVRGCSKHCSFCSVWKTDGQRPRQLPVDTVIRELVELRRVGFRVVALADDNFYPVSLTDIEQASRRADRRRFDELTRLRAERFELMARMADLPADMFFFTQITMEAAEDPSFLDAMRRARIKGALVGVESVTPEGLKAVYKGFNASGENLVQRISAFTERGVHVLGSFIFGLPSDGPDTFDATVAIAERTGMTFAQFALLTPYPGTVDFARWEESMGPDPAKVAGVPLTRHWLMPQSHRLKIHWPHPVMSAEEIARRTQAVWDRFYSLRLIWKRAACVKSLRSKMAFVLISKLYRQMYANTGIVTDSARTSRSVRWARWIAKPCVRLFAARPMPTLEVPLAAPPAA
jgi:radical SAM superfamily enzyme YgiQ (UPF0313 family)